MHVDVHVCIYNGDSYRNGIYLRQFASIEKERTLIILQFVHRIFANHYYQFARIWLFMCTCLFMLIWLFSTLIFRNTEAALPETNLLKPQRDFVSL